MKNLPRNLVLTKKQMITKTLRTNTRMTTLLLCIVAMLTCVSVTFAWFGSTFENLNTVITMGEYSADVSVYDESGNIVESMSADNGETVSFDNTQKKSGWSSGDVSAYYIYVDNTGEIDIKTYFAFASQFLSANDEEIEANKASFSYLVKDVTKDAENANGVANLIKAHKIPDAEVIRTNGNTFAEEESVLAGKIESGKNAVYALYFCCYDLANEYVSSDYRFEFNTKIITSQAGAPETTTKIKDDEISELGNTLNTIPSSEATEPSTSVQSTTQQTTTVQATTKPANTQSSAKNEWVWKYNDANKNTVTILEYNGTDSSVTIPSLADGAVVTTLGDNLFKNSKAQTVTVPACVTSFATDTFTSANLKTVKFQSRTTVSDKIYESPFTSDSKAIYTADKTALVRFLPQNNENGFVVSENIKAIYDKAFSGCTNLTTLSIKNVNYVSELTFSGSSIKEFRLYNEEVVTAVGTNVFGNTKTVTIRTLPSMKNAYKNATAVKGYTVKNDLKTDIYRNYPTTECNGLTYVLLTNNDEYKGVTYTLEGCKEFVVVTGCKSVSDDGVVIIPDTIICDNKVYNVAGIADGAFKNCKKLKTLVLPDSDVAYTSKAFEGCDNLGVIQNNDVVPFVSKIEETSALPTEGEKENDTQPTDGDDSIEPTE